MNLKPSKPSVLTYLLFLLPHLAVAVQRFEVRPVSTHVIEGQTAQLNCTVRDQVGAVVFLKNGFLLGSDRRLEHYERLSMEGSNSRGEYNLVIRNAQLEDDGNYSCQAMAKTTEDGRLNPLIKTEPVRLTVMVPPTAPKLTNYGDVITAQRSVPVKVQCSSEAGRPQPEFSWYIAEDVRAAKIVREVEGAKTTKTEKTATTGAMSELNYEPLKQDNKHYLLCLIRHPVLQQNITTAALLRIQYKPELEILPNTTAKLREGDSLLLTCKVTDANPDLPMRFEWLQHRSLYGADGSTSEPETHPIGNSPTLMLPRLHPDAHHRTRFECRARNEVGTSSVEYRVELEYGPRLDRETPRIIRTDEGTTIKLKCVADSNPPADIFWYRGPQRKSPLHQGPEYRIHDVSGDDAAVYYCVAKQHGFKTAELDFEVYINGPPSVSMKRHMRAAQRESVQINCRVRGEPAPRLVFWSFRPGSSCDAASSSEAAGEWIQLIDVLTEESKHRFQWDKVLLPKRNEVDGSRLAVLRISQITHADYGCYNCSTVSDYGRDSDTTELIETETIPLYYLVPAVVAGAALLLALAVCLICIQRQYLCGSTKSSQDGNDGDVMIKVEALDGAGPLPSNHHRFYPDMYANSDPPQYNGNKPYMPLALDDPPPYMASHRPSPPSTGYSVMTYIDDSHTPLLANAAPVAIHANGSAGDYAPIRGNFYGDNSVAAYQPAAFPVIPYSHNSPVLETLHEVPTPATPLDHQHTTHHVLSPRRSPPASLRSGSQLSTHV